MLPFLLLETLASVGAVALQQCDWAFPVAGALAGYKLSTDDSLMPVEPVWLGHVSAEVLQHWWPLTLTAGTTSVATPHILRAVSYSKVVVEVLLHYSS